MSYTDRQAVRVVAFNAKGEVAIIYAKRENYYKLRGGGGIDPGEEHEAAAKREFQEETGGLIKLHLVDESGKLSLTEEEVGDGLGHIWAPVEEARRLMAAAEPTSEFGRFIK
ncbi:hypothetical protein N0V88_007801 [Collariella sp. IMI 366227]|nr:hypothetical protein N0V88_007801 [Collariella sp. IMI 366227]